MIVETQWLHQVKFGSEPNFILVAVSMKILIPTRMMRNRAEELRLARDLSLQDVADRIGQSNQNVSNAEKRGDQLDIRWAKILGKAFDVPPEDVLGAGLDEELMRRCITSLIETAAHHNNDLTPGRFAALAVLLYQQMRQVDAPAERDAMMATISRALYAQAAATSEPIEAAD